MKKAVCPSGNRSLFALYSRERKFSIAYPAWNVKRWAKKVVNLVSGGAPGLFGPGHGGSGRHLIPAISSAEVCFKIVSLRIRTWNERLNEQAQQQALQQLPQEVFQFTEAPCQTSACYRAGSPESATVRTNSVARPHDVFGALTVVWGVGFRHERGRVREQNGSYLIPVSAAARSIV